MADDLNSLLDEGPSSQGKIVKNSDPLIDDRDIVIDNKNTEAQGVELRPRPKARSSSSKKESKHGYSKTKSSSSKWASQDDFKLLSSQMSNLTDLVTDSFKKWGPIITEMSQAYSDYQNNIDDSCESDDADDSARHRSITITKTKPNSSSDKEEGEIDEVDNYLEDIIGDGGNKVGPKIQDNVAQAITKVLSQGLGPDSQEKLHKYHTPSNCPRLVVTKCNQEIFKNLSKPVTMKDIKFQKIQSHLIQSLTANIYVYNSLQKMCKGTDPIDKIELKKQVDSLADAMSLQAHVSNNLDKIRRINIKPEVADEFASLCSEEAPSDSTLLFGDIMERIKHCTDTAKITKRVHRRGASQFRYKQRFHPFGIRGSSVKRWGNRNQNQQYRQNGGNSRNNYKSYNYNRSDSFKKSKTQRK